MSEQQSPPKLFKNNKTGGIYQFLGYITNTTNDQDGQVMIRYRAWTISDCPDFVRESQEFYKKFTETLSDTPMDE